MIHCAGFHLLRSLLGMGLLWVVLCGGESRALAQVHSARRFTTIDQLLAGYTTDQHLYVQGELGVGPQQLADLEEWLDREGPHWTVVLLQRSDLHYYMAADGRQFHGMDAVEFALGHGLANRTPFGTLEHPLTGETDGAVFVLFLEDRKFSYYASDAQDRRGLGESRWIGDLDREARSAMQNGGRIVDAVRNTVSRINERLQAAVEGEARAAEEQRQQLLRADQERKRAVEAARARIDETLGKLVPEVEALAARFQKEFPSAAAAPLALPPLARWKSALIAARESIDEKNLREISQTVEQTIAGLHREIDLHSAHRSFSLATAPLEKRWENMTFHAAGHVADRHSQEAERLLAAAKLKHASGDPGFVGLIQQATAEIELGEAEVFAEVQRMEQASGRRRAVRGVLLACGGILFMLLVFIAWLMNWRRRPALKAACSAFEKAAALVACQSRPAGESLARFQTLVGSTDQFRARGFAGKTLDLAGAIDRDCDALRRALEEARRVLDMAESLLEPASPLAIAANMVSASRYLTCTNLLQDRSFNASAAENEPLAADKGSWATLEQFLELLAAIRLRADERMDRLEHSLQTARSGLAAREQEFASLVLLQQSLEDASLSDGYLQVPDFETGLLPALRRRLDSGGQRVDSDPLQVAEQINADLGRQMRDAAELVSALNRLRQSVFPRLDAAGDRLRARQHRVDWIEEQVVGLGQEAGKIFQIISKADAAERIGSFSSSVSELDARVSGILEVADSIPEQLVPLIEKARGSLAAARTTIASALGIDAAAAIVEDGYNPDDHLASAEAQWSVARSAVDLGKLELARIAVQTGRIEEQRAGLLVRESLAALAGFDAACAAAEKQAAGIQSALPEAASRVRDAEKEFAAAAMTLHAAAAAGQFLPARSDPPVAVSAETAGSQLASARQMADAAGQFIQAAPENHRAGRVLQAASHLQLAVEGLNEAKIRIERAVGHCRRLESLVAENARGAADLAARMKSLEAAVSDLRCELATQEVHADLAKKTIRLAGELSSRRTGMDPFGDAEKLGQLRMASEDLENRIEGDFAAFQQASLAVDGAKNELAAVERLVRKSQSDQIPDSATIDSCQEDADRLAAVVQQATTQLGQPHGDWRAIQTAAATVTADLGLVAGSLVRELQLAEQASADFRESSEAVFRAARWSGSFGIRIGGEPGSSELENARLALSAGDYPAAIGFCREAIRSANEAVQRAEQAVLQKRREIAEAAERQRRQAAVAIGGFGSSGRSSGGISFGGGGSPGRSWSSGGGSSRSAGGGSGFKRSGW